MNTEKNNNKRKYKIILIIFIIIIICICGISYFSFSMESKNFHEELYSFLTNNNYNSQNIEDEFLKENNLFDDEFVCSTITYTDGVLEFIDCTIYDETKDFCIYDGENFDCYDKNLESDLNVEFISEIDNISYTNQNVILDTNIVENSDLEIEKILYCNTSNDKCIPDITSDTNTFEISEESNTSKVCVMAEYTNNDLSEITCSKSYKIDKTIPTISYNISGEMGENGWYISDVEITDYKADDNLSGVKNFNITKSLVDYETKGENIIISAEDMAGNKIEEILSIKIDKSAPVVGDFVINGTIGNNGWYVSDVTVETSGASDDISGVRTSTVDKSNINYETVGEKIILTTTDNAGHTATKEMTLRIDKNKPKLEYEISGTTGDNGWYITDVEIKNDSASDDISGIKSYDINKTLLDYETKGENIIITAEDKAGNISQEVIEVKIDKTAPIASTFDISGTTGDNGWYKSDLIINSTGGSDDISGISGTIVSKEEIDYETNGETISLITTDNAGHTATREIVVKIDKTNPTITYDFSGDKEDNDWYITNVSISNFIANDSGSGINNYNVSNYLIDYNTTGEQIIITAEDNAGNVIEEIINVKVDLIDPTITVKSSDIANITFGDSVDVRSYFNDPVYGISGEDNIVCNPLNTSTLTVGVHTVECTVTSLSGRFNTGVKSVKVSPDNFKLTDYITDNIGNGELVNENGIRYEGENPDNYITFNNEEWRIIGLFDTKLADGSSENLVKIIKSTPLDYNNDGIFDINRSGEDTHSWSNNVTNRWENSTLHYNLNTEYLLSSGVFLNNGISSEYGDLIKEVIWNLGGISGAATANDFYASELAGARPTNHASEWNAKVGLMYASDYLYAASADVCSRELTSREYEQAECHEQNWLFILDDYEGSTKYEWILNTYVNHTYLSWNIDSKGYLYYNHVGHEQIIRPTVYISSDIIISEGTGTKTDPFIIE